MRNNKILIPWPDPISHPCRDLLRYSPAKASQHHQLEMKADIFAAFLCLPFCLCQKPNQGRQEIIIPEPVRSPIVRLEGKLGKIFGFDSKTIQKNAKFNSFVKKLKKMKYKKDSDIEELGKLKKPNKAKTIQRYIMKLFKKEPKLKNQIDLPKEQILDVFFTKEGKEILNSPLSCDEKEILENLGFTGLLKSLFPDLELSRNKFHNDKVEWEDIFEYCRNLTQEFSFAKAFLVFLGYEDFSLYDKEEVLAFFKLMGAVRSDEISNLYQRMMSIDEKFKIPYKILPFVANFVEEEYFEFFSNLSLPSTNADSKDYAEITQKDWYQPMMIQIFDCFSENSIIEELGGLKRLILFDFQFDSQNWKPFETMVRKNLGTISEIELKNISFLPGFTPEIQPLIFPRVQIMKISNLNGLLFQQMKLKRNQKNAQFRGLQELKLSSFSFERLALDNFINILQENAETITYIELSDLFLSEKDMLISNALNFPRVKKLKIFMIDNKIFRKLKFKRNLEDAESKGLQEVKFSFLFFDHLALENFNTILRDNTGTITVIEFLDLNLYQKDMPKFEELNFSRVKTLKISNMDERIFAKLKFERDLKDVEYNGLEKAGFQALKLSNEGFENFVNILRKNIDTITSIDLSRLSLLKGFTPKFAVLNFYRVKTMKISKLDMRIFEMLKFKRKSDDAQSKGLQEVKSENHPTTEIQV